MFKWLNETGSDLASFLFNCAYKNAFLWARVEILLLCAFFWGTCRNITIQEPGGAGFSCRAIFGVCADIFVFGEIFTSGFGWPGTCGPGWCPATTAGRRQTGGCTECSTSWKKEPRNSSVREREYGQHVISVYLIPDSKMNTWRKPKCDSKSVNLIIVKSLHDVVENSCDPSKPAAYSVNYLGPVQNFRNHWMWWFQKNINIPDQ